MSDIDPEAARRAIRERSEEIARAELERALDRLDAQGALTPARRAALDDMTAAVVDALLAGLESALAETDDPETARTAVELFDPE